MRQTGSQVNLQNSNVDVSLMDPLRPAFTAVNHVKVISPFLPFHLYLPLPKCSTEHMQLENSAACRRASSK